MSRNNNGCGFGADILALCVFAVNGIGGATYYKSPHSTGGMAGLAALAIVDVALAGAAVYSLYKCCKPKPNTQQREYEVSLLPLKMESSKDSRPGDVEAALNNMHAYPR